ncbi:anhydro-N-acetylmuramic acid kinase [Chelatococcus daeguensis]|uniref:anhydro-N-acetylmuramic acid kinase n=1 Tax=Chelatococcus daeguensis TaxID=444444 RepID=UPI0007AB715B|nr:anhydro-N-acetylmuramic acid kinase [Chelatococcus daeguensis]KZE36062.1 anhydro-N-acetylmuramic acid kinase [Chelatococcus daeguensis]MBM3084210.1 anhydro-N-acetylmuramic acid kinase [Chelatococcus daeguensis]
MDGKPVWAIGLMTGTALDGQIDIAALRTDGERIDRLGPYALSPYPAAVQALLTQAVAAARGWNFTGPEPAIFAEAEMALTRAQAEAVKAFMGRHGLSAADVAAVGFHGQTMLHRAPQPGRPGDTRQLGDGALMAEIVGVPVVFDFRTADVRAGGQGAPLAASYHAALLRRGGLGPEAAVLNLGGVANVTWWGGGDDLVAFDTGPANGPLNDWMKQHAAGEMDVDGAAARRGRVDEARLARLLDHPYLAAPYPKSLDRYDFTAAMADGLTLEDGAATLTAFTAAAVGRGLDLLPRRPDRLVLCGGGRRNPALVSALAERAGVTAVMAEDAGWRGDAVEAECFAFLAVRRLRGLPISFPTTTGVPEPMAGGRVAMP